MLQRTVGKLLEPAHGVARAVNAVNVSAGIERRTRQIAALPDFYELPKPVF